MKSILLLVFSLFTLTVFSQSVEIKLFNKTGYDIGDLNFGAKNIGNLKKNSFMVFTVDSLRLFSKVPFEAFKGSIKNIKTSTIESVVSAEDVSTVKSGKYSFDVVLVKHPYTKGVFTLDFNTHKK